MLKYLYLYLSYSLRYGVRLRRKAFWEAYSGTSTAGAEEFAEQFYGFGLQDAAIDVDGMVEAGIGGDVMEGTCVAGFRVGGGIDEARDPGCVGGAGAHGAGFQCGVEGATGQAPAA